MAVEAILYHIKRFPIDIVHSSTLAFIRTSVRFELERIESCVGFPQPQAAQPINFTGNVTASMMCYF